MGKFCPSHLARKTLITMLLAGILLLWAYFDLPCLFRAVSGIPCPSCGMGRAWLAVMRLDFSAAFSFHPMFWSVPVFWLFAVYDLRLLKNRRMNDLILGLLMVGFSGCYLLRLVAYFRGISVL